MPIRNDGDGRPVSATGEIGGDNSENDSEHPAANTPADRPALAAPDSTTPNPATAEIVPPPDTAATATAAREAQKLQTFPLDSRASVLTSFGIKETRKKTERPHAQEAVYLIIDSDTVKDKQAQKSIRAEVALLVPARYFEITQDDNGNLVIISLAERGVKKLLDIANSIKKAFPFSRMALKTGKIVHDTQEKDTYGLLGYPENSPTAPFRNRVSGTTSIHIAKHLAETIQRGDTRLGDKVAIRISDIGDPDFYELADYKSKVSRLKRGGPDILIGNEEKLDTLLKALGITTDEEETVTTRLVFVDGKAGDGKSSLIEEGITHHHSVITCSIDDADKSIAGSSLVTLADQLISILEEDEMDIAGIHDAREQKIEKPRAKIAPRGEPKTGPATETAGAEAEAGVAAKSEATAELEPKTIIYLANYATWSNAQKIEFAASHPQIMADLCTNALNFLCWNKAENTALIIEDLHHADRISLPYLMKVTSRFLKEHPESRAVLSRRPEEMYKSLAEADLTREVTELAKAQIAEDLRIDDRDVDRNTAAKAVKIIQVEGLDFKNPDITRRFAFHCLPREIRISENGRPRQLGNWPLQLGCIAGTSPLVMANLMDALKEKDETGEYKHLIITDTHIIVKEAFFAATRDIDPSSESDIARYFHGRIRNLDDNTRTVLQCAALMGGRITTQQIGRILDNRNLVKLRHGEAIKIMGRLMEGCYAQQLEKGVYGLQHETTKAIVIGSITDEEERIQLAQNLSAEFGAELKPSQKYELLRYRAESENLAPELNNPFWKTYAKTSAECLEDLEAHHNTGDRLKICKTTLETKRIQEARRKLETGDSSSVPDNIRSMVILSLFAQAESAALSGKSEDLNEAAASLILIHSHNEEGINIIDVHLLRFYSAYLLSDIAEMKKIFKDDLLNGAAIPENAIRAMIQIKLLYKQGKNEEAKRVFDENASVIGTYNDEYQRRHHKTPSPEYVNILRLATSRIPFETARQGIIHQPEGRHFDQSVIYHPRATNDAQRRMLESSKDELSFIRKLAEMYPLIIDPNTDIAIRGQAAETEAHLGNLDEAVQQFGEVFRVAMQMGTYEQAARAAKMKGDVQIIQALEIEDSDSEVATKRRAGIKKALKTYSEEGMLALKETGQKSLFQAMIRMDRIRATGLLTTTYDLKGIDAARRDTKDELTPLIQTAMEDFAYLNENWPRLAEDPDDYYDLMGYVYYVLYATQQLNLLRNRDIIPENILDAGKFSLMSKDVVNSALARSATMVDSGIGEVDRKIAGLRALKTTLESAAA